MRSLEHTGDSANIAYYRERGQEGEVYLERGKVFAHVLRSDFGGRVVNGERELVVYPVPRFSFTVYVGGVGEVCSFSYEPKSKPAPGPLSSRTVTRLVRKHLGVSS